MLLITGSAQASGVYKCVLEGHTVFTDTPCVSEVPSDLDLGFPPMETAESSPAASTDEMAFANAPAAGGEATASSPVDYLERQREIARARADVVRVAVQTRTVLRGMDMAQVESVLGAPCIYKGDRQVYWRQGQRVTVEFDGLRKVSEVDYKRAAKPMCQAKGQRG